MPTQTTTQTESPRGRWACLSFTELLSAGRLREASACFARDACLLTQDATAIHDRQHIRPVLAQLIARGTQIRVEQSNVLMTGDVALVREVWTIEIDGVEGSRFEQACTPMMVLHQIEGQWKLALLAPWGWGSGSERAEAH